MVQVERKIGFMGESGTSEDELTTEIAAPVPYSNRSPWTHGNLVMGITPGKLASIMETVRQGDVPAEYLELCQEIERRDTHYRSVLSTRKHSVESLKLSVEAVSDDKTDQDIAEAVRVDILKHSGIRNLIKDSLDALGKGFAVSEIIWDTTGPRWKPKRFQFCDPRWFAYDKTDGRTLCLRDPQGSTLNILKTPNFVTHEPFLLSGPQILSGLSYTALFMWLIKNYDVTSWAAFVDRFGYPVRLGKYGRKATPEDITTLKRAVAAIGSDVGAVIPDSMILEIIEAKTTSQTADVYERLANWVNKELSKLVLGQTASTEGQPGSLGNQQGQEEVRQDIIDADAIQLEETLNRDLVIPYCRLNFGDSEAYPRLILRRADEQDVTLIVDSIEKLGPLGFKVKSEEIRNLLGLSKPDDNDEVIGGMATTPPVSPNTPAANSQQKALNAQTDPGNSPAAAVEDELIGAAETSDFVSISDDIAAVLEQAATDSNDFEGFKSRLESLVPTWPADKVAELIAVATFKARARGDSEFDS